MTPRNKTARIYRNEFPGLFTNSILFKHWFGARLLGLALILGVWSNGRKLFEVLHVSLWYLALNKVAAADYFGANSSGNVGFFMPLTLILLVIAFIGRAKQLQN